MSCGCQLQQSLGVASCSRRRFLRRFPTYVTVRCQAFLEAPSIASRLKLGLTALRKHRKVLVALTSLKGLEDA